MVVKEHTLYDFSPDELIEDCFMAQEMVYLDKLISTWKDCVFCSS